VIKSDTIKIRIHFFRTIDEFPIDLIYFNSTFDMCVSSFNSLYAADNISLSAASILPPGNAQHPKYGSLPLLSIKFLILFHLKQ
jgi:hypothetical protein